LIIAQDAGWKR